ncbi:MAG: glycosyltransferase family 4 protein [Nitrospinota bacterium]|nr:glycosyltransferase family 4 protein [Nitrospinota bacterium]
MAAACPFPGVQGSQVLIQELITGLAARGHRIDLVTYPFRMDAQWRCPEGCRIHRVNTGLRYPAQHPGLHPVKPLLDAALARLLEEVVRWRGADLIHAHSFEGLAAALWVRRQTRTPVLYHSHTLLGEELPTYYRPGPVRFLSKWAGLAADRLLPPRADHCIALSPRAARTFQRMGVRSDRISCLPPFVIHPDPGPPGGGSGRGAPYVLYAGNLHPYQDLDLLLRSFRIVAAAERKTHLRIVTHNDPSPWERRMERLGLEGRVTFLTGLPFEREWEWMSDAAVLALPRLRCPGYPMKLLNYLAAARPIVASEDSARGLTHGRDAYVVTDPGPEAFAGGLLRVLRSRPLAHRLAVGAGRTSKESLNPRNLLGSLERIYERVSPPSRIWVSRMAAAAV